MKRQWPQLLFLEIVMAVLVIWLCNQLADRFSVQADLTEEKRYTLSPSTRKLLERLDENVYFEVYLEGELPSNFLRFKKSMGEMLERFVEISGGAVSYKFVDPSTGSREVRNKFYQELINRGIQATNLNYTTEGDRREKIIFPGATVSRGSREVSINLISGNSALGPEGVLNQSVEGLEYGLASAIAKLGEPKGRKIGWVTGHGSPDSLDIVAFKNAVLSQYQLFNLSLDSREEILGYSTIIIGKPTQSFSEKEKYLIDQYLMRGGNVMFFLDALRVNMDSAAGDGTVAIPYETNLTDMLFKYGVRINNDYVLDVNSGDHPVVTGNIGEQPQINMIPWPFFPVLTNFTDHPSVRNLDAILGRFVSSIDTVKAEGVKKIPLLISSPYTKVLGPPVKVAFNDLRDKLLPEKFTDGPKAVAYLLEGKFTSLFANRLVPRAFDKAKFVQQSSGGKVVVVADGDIIRNDLDPETGGPLEMGVEPFRKTTYANKAFVLNLLDYLNDDSGLIDARNREVKLRPLDKVKLTNSKSLLQMINLVLPILLVVLIGFVKHILRRRRYTS